MAEKPTPPVNPMALEDAVLVRQVQEGDTGAFERLVLKYQDRVVNLCWRMCGSLEDSQDLAQEAFLLAFAKIGVYRFEASFYTWLFRIAVNTALTHRRRTRRVMLSLHNGDGNWGDEVSNDGRSNGRQTDEVADPLAGLTSRETHERLIAALDAMEDEHRSIVVLRDIEGMDYQQIAEVLEVSVGTVKSRLYRARLVLRDIVLKGERQTSTPTVPVNELARGAAREARIKLNRGE